MEQAVEPLSLAPLRWNLPWESQPLRPLQLGVRLALRLALHPALRPAPHPAQLGPTLQPPGHCVDHGCPSPL